MDRAFSAALRAAEGAPESEDAWNHLEELADELQRPDEVADLYRAVLERRLAKQVFSTVAERAVQFHEEWFGDTADKITGLISRIIELDPAADWAFERLSVMLTSAGQWDELLALYDRTLAHTQDHERKRQLLNDAAQAAKDFADQADRAADYMQQLVQLEPGNAQLLTSLERLLEKGGRWTDLVELWESRLEHLASDEARETRLRIARVWLERLSDNQKALDGLRSLLGDHPGLLDACQLAEGILQDDEAELATRRQALSLLRKNYLVAERPEDVIRVLQRALQFIEPDERRPLHREAATRLAILGRDLEAIEHYKQLLLSDPTDTDARKQLRQLAKRTGRQDLHAQALVAAAEAATDEAQKVAVLVEAANLYRTALDDTDNAAALYSRVLDSPDAEPSVALAAAHNLDELLASAERHEQRLAVLEKLSELERSPAVRRIVLGEAARLAEALGDADRALANWQPVLDAQTPDVEALATVTALLENNERWAELVDVLRKRADSGALPLQRRADLIRIAEIHSQYLDQTAEAIDTWLLVRRDFGDDAECIDALTKLMAASGRHKELADLLEQAATREHARSAGLLTRLGDLYKDELDDPSSAARWYARSLAIDGNDEAAHQGLRALLDTDGASTLAASALARAYEDSDNWQGTLELVDARLAASRKPLTQARILREAAALHLRRGKDAGAALEYLCRALPLEPDNLATEAMVMKLAEQTGTWKPVAQALGAAAAQAGEALSRAAQLRKAEAAIHETWLEDPDAALCAYRAAAETHATDAEIFEAIARCAARAEQWDVASDAAVRAIGLRDRIIKPVLVSLESCAREPQQARAMASALSAALAARPLRPELALQLEMTIALWFRDRCEDLDAAEQAAARAVEHDPNKLEALLLLSSLQRRRPGAPLITTLLRLNRVQPQSLDALFEAAQLATSSEHDVDKTRSILEQLYRKAGGMWIRSEAASGEQTAPAVAQWALDQLIAQHIEAGDADGAVHTLLDGTRLPLDTEKLIELRRRAAEMLADRGEIGRSIDIYRAVLDARPRDVEALGRVAELCEQQGRVSEALSLRLRELEMVEDVERRLQLRLDHSRLTGALEAQGGRVASLKANLEDAPGHAASIDELCGVLLERGRHQELADILTQQAAMLEQMGSTEPAAQLWTRVADLAEKPLHDAARAIAAHAQVVSLGESNDSIDALARLHLEQAEPAEAARWLEKRLATTAPADRVAVLLKLARARIRADQQKAAIETLSTAFDEAPRNAEVRKLLLKLHRGNKDWDSLAKTLAKAALCVTDERAVVSYAREAAELYHARLGRPEQSVAALTRAVEIAEDDRELRGLLAEALSAAGELDQAKSILEALVADFGRRRSPERAQAHLKLARVCRAQGEIEQALDHLETASKMDASNATILMTLADMAREAGQLDRAERAYRTLLVTVRRESEPGKLPFGPSEVLLELSRIAAARDDKDKAAELIESVLESLAQNDYEAPQIQQRLRDREDWTLLERVLRARLGYVDAPHRRAQILGDLGDVLDGALDQPDEAFRSRLEAVRTDPGSPIHHQAARDHAARLERLDDYVSVVETLLTDERADNNAHVGCELLLRLGEVLEKERGDLERAAELYAQAEHNGVRQVDVWRAQARVAGARGDSEEQMRLLSQLASLGEDQAETRADALYRIAEVQLASAETVDDGLASLQTALDDTFRAERAALILQRVSEQHPDHVGLLDLYEQVARRSEDDKSLLHYLERRAHHQQATPEQAREAVEKAVELGEEERAEELLLRAAEIGKAMSRSDDLARVDWALLGLARRRLAAGDLAGAVKWLSDAAEVAELDAVLELAAQVAEMAGQPDGDLTLAAKLYERLLERAPAERGVWEPLADIYARLGNVEQLERMVEETLDGLQNPHERNVLRVTLARALLMAGERADDAVEVLREVLLEDPQLTEAQSLLIEHLERSGKGEELLELLREQLESAQRRMDPQSIKTASLNLALRVETEDGDEALAILRAALQVAPDDAELLTALLERISDDDPGERATLSEALIRVEPPESAGPRALALAELYKSLDDDEGELRALRLGAERAPDNDAILHRLQERYRDRGDYRGLAESLVSSASRTEDESTKLDLLREAATLYRDELGEASTAANLMSQALELAPGNVSLSVELARAQGASGSHADAIATIGGPLEAAEDDATRLELLVARAELFGASGDPAAAIGDLEQAFAIDSASVAPHLESVLEAQLEAAAMRGDAEAERRYSLRCVDMMLAQSKRVEASELLSSWTDRSPDDLDALRRLRDIDSADGRWEDVARTCQRLVSLEEGSAQIDAALALSHAYHELGEPVSAREGLEKARAAQPDNPQVRAELRKIYEHLGDRRLLAGLLVDDAAAARDNDERVSLLLRAGQIFVELGDAATSVPLLREAHELVPGDPTATSFLADAYILAGWFDDANDLLDGVIAQGRGRRTPEMAMFFHRKAQVAAAIGDHAQQLQHLQEAHLCNKKNGVIAAELADQAEEMGDWDLAAKTLRTITLIDSDCPITRGEAFLRQGRIAHRQGDDKSAKMWARRAKREEPDAEEVDTFLMELGERPSRVR